MLGYISLGFLAAFVAVSADLVRVTRKRRSLYSSIVDEASLEQDIAAEMDAEDAREESSGWDAPDFLSRDDIPREMPQPLDKIETLTGTYLTEATTPLIICSPTLDGMIGTAILLQKIPWAQVRVVYKDYFVKSIWKFMRMKPNPDHFIVVGIDAGYVHGRRLIQTMQRVKEQGIKFAWYDNHDWVPIIAKNLSDLCFDFQLIKPEYSSAALMAKRFSGDDKKSHKLMQILEFNPDTDSADSWTEKWRDLLNFSIVERVGMLRTKLVKRLAKLASFRPIDYLYIRRYRKRSLLTRLICEQQAHFETLLSGSRLSVLDIRPLHREHSPDGKMYFVFRGEKPTYELPEFAFKLHGTECLLIVESFMRLVLYANPDGSLNLTRLIDITTVDGSAVHVDGREDRVTIQLDIPFRRRLFHTLTFSWPKEIPALINKIKARL